MSDSYPLVSIIIPLFNSEQYLKETIESALSQTYLNKEIIIVDDGSTDQSLSVCKSFLSNKITIIEQKNAGAAAARNTGLKHCSGKYIQFLDADDILGQDKIKTQVIELAKNGNENKLAVCKTVYFSNEDNHLLNTPSDYETSFLFSSNDPFEFLVNLWGGNGANGSMIQTNAWLVPKSLIINSGYWEEFYSPDDDGEFFTRQILNSDGIIYTPTCLNYYRKYSSTHSLSNRNSLNALEGCYKSIILKKQTLSHKLCDYRVKKVLSKQLMDIAVKAYPNNLKLVKKILSDIKSLGITIKNPILGGSSINTICKMFGWKAARQLQHYKHLYSK